MTTPCTCSPAPVDADAVENHGGAGPETLVEAFTTEWSLHPAPEAEGREKG